jgi:prepilin signal peptidase PulO-like enzyme (type II secretory pathway)
MHKATEQGYTVPARYRRMENMHIIFWLFKDISWCLELKPLGIAMVFPTLIISIIITWRTRSLPQEFAHNMAVSFWIIANSYWMVSEFFAFDEAHIWRGIEARHLAVVPFVLGLGFLAYYYLFQKRREVPQPETMVH